MPTIRLQNSNLIVPPIYSLGWEFEATRGAVVTPKMVNRGRDGSVNNEGVEYRTNIDVVQNPFDSILALRQLLILRRLEIDSSCGFHVHIGLKPDDNSSMSAKRAKLWAAWCVSLAKEIEEKAYLAVDQSRRENRHCRKWKGVLIEQGVIGQRYSSDKYANQHRYQWLNITEMFRDNGIRTMEVRLCGASMDFGYLFSWMCFCLIMAESARRLLDDPSRLDYEAEFLKRMLASIIEVRSTYRADGGYPDNVVRTIFALGKYAGLLQDDFPKFEKFINAKMDEKSPELNSPDENEHYKIAHHNNAPRSPEEYEAMQRYGHFFPRCKCDECNYFRYEKKRLKEKKKIAKEVAPPPIAVDESAGFPWENQRLNAAMTTGNLNRIRPWPAAISGTGLPASTGAEPPTDNTSAREALLSLQRSLSEQQREIRIDPQQIIAASDAIRRHRDSIGNSIRSTAEMVGFPANPYLPEDDN